MVLWIWVTWMPGVWRGYPDTSHRSVLGNIQYRAERSAAALRPFSFTGVYHLDRNFAAAALGNAGAFTRLGCSFPQRMAAPFLSGIVCIRFGLFAVEQSFKPSAGSYCRSFPLFNTAVCFSNGGGFSSRTTGSIYCPGRAGSALRHLFGQPVSGTGSDQ